MTRIRYGPRPPAALEEAAAARSRLPDIWSTGIVALWETDPDAVAAVLPPPLTPAARPLVRATVSRVDIPGHPLGAGVVALRCRHGDLEGDYAVTMPMTTERAVTGGREVFGEPKKLADIRLDRDGDRVTAAVTRHGVTYLEIRGRVTGALEPPAPRETLSFYYKFLPAVDGAGFDADPLLVHVWRDERTRSAHHVEGEVVLRDSDFDPVADLPVRRLVSLTLAERTSGQRGKVAARVPADLVLPYIHQRYDDVRAAVDAPPATGEAG